MNPTCPVCSGECVELGILGRLKHFKCRACGWLFNIKLPKGK